MYNAKQLKDNDRKGSISYTLGDRKYFGAGVENIYDKGVGFYCNVYQSIFGKFK